MSRRKAIGGRTIEALELVNNVMDDESEKEPNLSLTDACIDLVDAYKGDTADDELRQLLKDLQAGIETIETAVKPDQTAKELVGAANAVIHHFDDAG